MDPILKLVTRLHAFKFRNASTVTCKNKLRSHSLDFALKSRCLLWVDDQLRAADLVGLQTLNAIKKAVQPARKDLDPVGLQSSTKVIFSLA